MSNLGFVATDRQPSGRFVVKKWNFLTWLVLIGGVTIVNRSTADALSSPFTIEILHRFLSIAIVGTLLLQSVFQNISVPFQKSSVALFAFALVQLSSTIWSVNPVWTGLRSLEYLVVLLLAVYSANSFRNIADYLNWSRIYYIWLILLLISIVLGALFLPSVAFSGLEEVSLSGTGLLQGVYPRINPNSVSAYFGALLVICVSRYIDDRKKRYVLLALLSLFFMGLAHGRSGFLGAFVGVIVVLVLRRQYSYIFLAVFLAFSLAVVSGLGDTFLAFFQRGQSEEQLLRLTGRFTLWEYAIQHYVVEKPFVGYGAYAGGRFLVLKDTVGWSSLHSAWMEVLVGTGLIGGLLLVVSFLWVWITLISSAAKLRHHVLYTRVAEILGIYALVSVRSIFSVHLISFNDFLFFLCIASAIFFRRVAKSFIHSYS